MEKQITDYQPYEQNTAFEWVVWGLVTSVLLLFGITAGAVLYGYALYCS